MNLTLKIAWRNIWRNKRRSLLVIAAIVSGLWGMVYMIAISEGMNQEMVDTAIESGIGHIQIHRAGFLDNMDVTKNIRDTDYFIKKIQGTPHLKAYARRIKVMGLVSSPESSSGVLIWGIDAAREPTVSAVKTYLKDGKFLGGESGEIYIGKALAEKLKVGVDDKIVLMAQGLSPDIGSAAFRIKGVFASSSPEFDKFNIYINLADAQELLSMGSRVSEIVIMADSRDSVDGLAEVLRGKLTVSGLEVLTWQQLTPLIVEMINMFKSFNYIIYIIVVLAMAFGIINTILMSVLERTREIGILMAIGTKRRRVFSEVMWEGFFLGIVGLTVGWTVNLLFYAIVSRTGIDLSMWADSLKYMGGIGTTLYPLITLESAVKSTISVLAATQLSALYPAIKIMRLSPVKAIRSV
jgi:ABC-type lipoprotein release transport system permease subunit